jgi:hypothetical protein
VNNKQIAEFFVEQHVLQPSQAEDVLNEADLNGKTIGHRLMKAVLIYKAAINHRLGDG